MTKEIIFLELGLLKLNTNHSKTIAKDKSATLGSKAIIIPENNAEITKLFLFGLSKRFIKLSKTIGAIVYEKAIPNCPPAIINKIYVLNV